MAGPAPFEPYVAEPAEPAPRVRGERFRPLAAVLIALVLAGAVAWLVIAAAAGQDPALEPPPADATDP